jgi:hypothetical protein
MGWYPVAVVTSGYQRDELITQIYFWNRTLHVSDSFSVHHQESSTVHTVIHKGYAYCFLAGSGWNSMSSILIPLASSQHNLHGIYLLLCVQTPDDGQRKCPKHGVEFYSKNKFEKLVHLVGFIIIRYWCSLRLTPKGTLKPKESEWKGLSN